MDVQTAAAVLGVSPTATKREISRAFRARAKLVHPDAAGPDQPGSSDEFIALRAAFDALDGAGDQCRPVGRVVASWFGPPRAQTIDLSDTPSRRPGRSSAAAPASRPGRRHRSFAEHLDAELARQQRR
jgi:hypothetical protein